MFDRKNSSFPKTILSPYRQSLVNFESWGFSLSAGATHLHACEIHRLVHQDPCGCLKAWRDGHRSIIRDKTTRLRVNLLNVQASKQIRIIWKASRKQTEEGTFKLAEKVTDESLQDFGLQITALKHPLALIRITVFLSQWIVVRENLALYLQYMTLVKAQETVVERKSIYSSTKLRYLSF